MYTDRELWRFLDKEMDPADALALEAAAERDPTLARRLDELAMLGHHVAAGAPTPPAGFAERVAALAGHASAPLLDLDDARRFMKRALIAAAILGAVGLAYLAFGLLPDLLAPDPMTANPLLGGGR